MLLIVVGEAGAEPEMVDEREEEEADEGESGELSGEGEASIAIASPPCFLLCGDVDLRCGAVVSRFSVESSPAASPSPVSKNRQSES